MRDDPVPPPSPDRQPGFGPREIDEPLLAGADEPSYDRASSMPEAHMEARSHSDGDPMPNMPAATPDTVDYAEEPLHTADMAADSPDAFARAKEEKDDLLPDDREDVEP